MFLDVWEHKGLRLFYAIINLENIMLQAWGKDTLQKDKWVSSYQFSAL